VVGSGLQIYIFVEGTRQEIALFDFQVDSINLKLHNINGKNY
jgi:hypothetical protein